MEPKSLISQLEPEKLSLKLLQDDDKKVIPRRKPISSFLNSMLFSVFTFLSTGILFWVVVKHMQLRKMHFKHALLVQTIKCISCGTVCLPLLNEEHLQHLKHKLAPQREI